MITLRILENPARHWDVFLEPNRRNAPPIATFPDHNEAMEHVLELARIRTGPVRVSMEFRAPTGRESGFFRRPKKRELL